MADSESPAAGASTSPPASRPSATNGTASRNSTIRCRAGGCGPSMPAILFAIGYVVVYPAIPLLTKGTEGPVGLDQPRPACRRNAGRDHPPRAAARRARRDADRAAAANPELMRDGRRRRARGVPGQLRAVPRRGRGGQYRAIPTSTTTTGCGAAISSEIETDHHPRHPPARRRRRPAPASDAGFRPGRILTAAQIDDVASYVRTLSGKEQAGRGIGARRGALRRQLRRLPRPARQGRRASSARRT